MGARLSDQRQYAHLWATPELTSILDEPGRLQGWLDILAALARAQSRLGLVPVRAAEQITAHALVADLDLDDIAAQTRLTSHSTLGVIRALQAVVPEPGRSFVALGATVQDVTDTWFGVVMSAVGAIVRRDLWALEGELLRLAGRHRDTVMAGRTHGQPGSAITFGFKAASWADEVRRHLTRLAQCRERVEVGQLAGAVGVLGSVEPDGLALRAEFCAELGLGDPGLSWLTARDRVAEFGQLLAMVCGTLARIGAEVYELARPEIGELAEATSPDAVGSITMPHKRNPEASEHLDTLARLARAQSGVLLEGMVSGHERDGRAWKAEWIALPEVCLLTGAALAIAGPLVAGLEVDAAAMAANLGRYGDRLGSERVLAELSARLGRGPAQVLLHEALAPARRTGRTSGDGPPPTAPDRRAGGTSGDGPPPTAPAADDLAAAIEATGAASRAEVVAWTAHPAVATAGAMVDAVLARAAAARAGEPTHGAATTGRPWD